MAIDTIPGRLFAQGDKLGSTPAYYEKVGEDWRPTSWRSYADQVWQAAKALIALGMEPGGSVAILGFNTPDWTIMDLACMAAGGAPAGVYTTNSPTEVAYIVEHAECHVILVQNKMQWEKVEQQLDNLPNLAWVVMMRGGEKVEHEKVLSWDAFVDKGEEVEDAALEERMDAQDPDQNATFIYTSGTTGPPKGVMLSHTNLTWTANTAIGLVGATSADCSVSYLPLSHIAEQMFTIHAPITAGWPVYYAESIEKLPDNLKEVEPTIVFGVPRIWEKMYAKVADRLSQATGLKKMIMDFALSTGKQVTDAKNRGEEVGGLLGLKYALANRLVFSKVKPLLGLNKARICVSGAAPISSEVLEFFAGLDIVIHEVYGQSEDCGPSTFNTPGNTRYGTVGKPLPGTEVKIAEDGEIVVKGPHVFQGYFKNEAATNETVIDGWLQSGDLGAFDDEGYLKITGRKKEIIITAGGKNIAPKNIEAAIKNCKYVSQAVVIGDRRKFLSALITLDPDAATAWASEEGVAVDSLPESDGMRKVIQDWIDSEVNPQFARVEHIRKFTILPREFSIEENELTPTLKIKRRIVDENWADTIEAMYQD